MVKQLSEHSLKNFDCGQESAHMVERVFKQTSLMGEVLHKEAAEVRGASEVVANENDFKQIDAERIRLSSFSPRRSSKNERKGLLQTVLE